MICAFDSRLALALAGVLLLCYIFFTRQLTAHFLLVTASTNFTVIALDDRILGISRDGITRCVGLFYAEGRTVHCNFLR